MSVFHQKWKICLTTLGVVLILTGCTDFLEARKSTQRAACIDNMRQIMGVIEELLIKGEELPSSVSDLCGDDKYIKTEPKCPADKNGASYIIVPPGSEDNWEFKIICPNADKCPDHVIPPY